MRIGSRIAILVGTVALVADGGCAHGPRRFQKIDSETPIVRARAVGLAGRSPDTRALPALVSRLNDPDPVVRLAAHEELRKRTGRDFGYRPWGTPEERSGAIDRWKAWVAHGDGPAIARGVAPTPQGKTLPAAGP